MGEGIVIGCNNCFSRKDTRNIDPWTADPASTKGTFFDLRIGGSMLLFCKEQLEEIYSVNKKSDRKHNLLLETATYDENIDKIIYEKIDKGFEFTENLGYNPYYCESCKKLFSHFYLEMVKDDNIYTPDYICKKCSNVLRLVYLSWINKNKRKIIKIKSNKGEEKLICENCGNDKFSILNVYNFD
jgi:hypothetical protein